MQLCFNPADPAGMSQRMNPVSRRLARFSPRAIRRKSKSHQTLARSAVLSLAKNGENGRKRSADRATPVALMNQSATEMARSTETLGLGQRLGLLAEIDGLDALAAPHD